MGQVCSGGSSEKSKPTAFDENNDDTSRVTGESSFEKGRDDHHASATDQNGGGSSQHLSSQNRLSPSPPDAGGGSAGETGNNNSSSDNRELQLQAEKHMKALREEQARLELIVSTAGRDMVAVRSARGNPGYYDQGFAAALAQHLEQTIGSQYSSIRQDRLPPSSTIVINNSSSTGDDTVRISSSSNNNKNIKNSSITTIQQSATTKGTTNIPSTTIETSPSSSTTSSKPLTIHDILSKKQWDGIMLGNKGTNPNVYMDDIAESLLSKVAPTKEQLFANVQPMVETLI